ncbi:MAG: hypothetical protein KKB20_29790 [Proteobacteria bacterium]|nr:hypothetical protein [Pseudomonadota bacterium]
MTEEKKAAMKQARISVLQGYAARLPMLMVRNVVEAFGEKGWQALEKAAREFAEYRAPLMKFLVEDPKNARSLGSIFDFEDGLSGVEGRWVEDGPNRATKLEESCVACEVFKQFPDYCGRFLWGVADETLKLYNPDVELTPFSEAKCLAYGDDCCEVKIKLPG